MQILCSHIFRFPCTDSTNCLWRLRSHSSTLLALTSSDELAFSDNSHLGLPKWSPCDLSNKSQMLLILGFFSSFSFCLERSLLRIYDASLTLLLKCHFSETFPDTPSQNRTNFFLPVYSFIFLLNIDDQLQAYIFYIYFLWFVFTHWNASSMSHVCQCCFLVYHPFWNLA